MTQAVGKAERTHFPLGVCAASILVTGVGLAFAAGGVRWGVEGGETIGLAWVYANCAMVVMWMVAWPMMRGRDLAWDFAAIILGAIPAMGVASFLAGMTMENIGAMAALQIAVGILACGVMARCEKMAAGTLGILAVVMPVVVYVWTEFFGVSDAGWFWGVPLVAVTRVAHGEVGAGLCWMVGIFLVCGVGMMLLRHRRTTSNQL